MEAQGVRNRSWFIPAIVLICIAAAAVLTVAILRAPGRETILLQAQCNGLMRLFAINPDG